MKSVSQTKTSKLRPEQGGYSLVEVLVAVTVLLVALVGPLTIAHSGLKRSYLSREQTMSVFLAQEGTETVVRLREDAALAAPDFNSASVWTPMQTLDGRCPVGSNVYCGVTLAGTGVITPASFYVCNATNCLMKYNNAAPVPYKQGASVGGVDTPFTRRMQIDVENSHARVVSFVSWGTSPSQQIELETYVYNTYYEPAP